MKRFTIILVFFVLVVSAVAQPRVIHIWHGTAVDKEDVTLTAYMPEHPNGTAVIVCPGGSYHWLDLNTEGHDVAHRINEHGITAFVLKYRVAGIAAFVTHYRVAGGGNRFPDMFQDLQRSIQLIRANAFNYNIDSGNIGVMGFSAGGHMALMAAVFGNDNYLERLGITSTVSLAPNFIAPIYPVVSMVNPCTHGRSRRGIMGENKVNDQQLRTLLSMELQANKIQCPVFLVNCVDDPIVDYHNSVLMDDALTSCNVPHCYLQFKTGGHGFGATPTKTSPEAATWFTSFLEWIKTIK
jgi:acetyl esterase/lipase